MLGIVRRLRVQGVLGINARNIAYIQRHNPRSHYPLVDDKLRTKRLALAAGIAVPELYGVMSTPHDTERLAELVTGHQEFVIKPAHGSGGDGILVPVAAASTGCWTAVSSTMPNCVSMQPISSAGATASAAIAIRR